MRSLAVVGLVSAVVVVATAGQSTRAIGQFITVLPELDMVIAHKTRPNATAVTRPQYLDVLERLAAARCAPN